MELSVYDLAVVGGGINGAGIAADAAGRGLNVILLEKGDLASGTSSASSKLIHGGLRYLEHWEFRLVREALAEREVLMARAPHLIRPLRFILPHAPSMRSRTMIRAGLFLYDHLAARRRIPASGAVDLRRDPAGRPLKAELVSGFSYYDCWADDARLVVAAAIDARERGATILTATPVTGLDQEEGQWRLTAHHGGREKTIRARVLVNAAGPWCSAVARLAGAHGAEAAPVPAIRLVRGTHLVVPRIPGADAAYILQNDDGRVVFALPFEHAFTLIGTTDVPVTTPEDGFVPSAGEEAYLLRTAAAYFAHPLAPASVVWRFAGVRPLIDDGAESAAAVSRDYKLDLVTAPGAPPLLNVVGGKITTFRRLAEAALARLAPFFPGMGAAWTAGSPLPGGDFEDGTGEAYLTALLRRVPGLSDATARRLVSRYGTRTERMLAGAATEADLGRALPGELTEREVLYLRDEEWALTPQDVLWRRTKAGLHVPAAERAVAEEEIARVLAS